MEQTSMPGRRRPVATVPDGAWRWAGYAAAACAFLFAVPSFHWGLGGQLGADTIGQQAVDLSWGTDPLIMLIVLATAFLKVAGGLLALGLVRPWGRTLPRGVMLTTGWGGAALLLLYGAVQLGVQASVGTGAITPPADFDWYAFHWHLYLWSPWFLVWGLLLGLATSVFQHATRCDGPASGTHASGTT